MAVRSSLVTVGRVEGCYRQLGERRIERHEWPVLGWPETRPVTRFGGGGRAARAVSTMRARLGRARRRVCQGGGGEGKVAHIAL